MGSVHWGLRHSLSRTPYPNPHDVQGVTVTPMTKWAGARVRRIITNVLATKGDLCHICGLPGADSVDHNPPRSQLIAAGVGNPDAMAYLFPAHLTPCNLARNDSPITPELCATLRRRRLAMLGQSEPPPALSPLFSSRRPSLF